MTFLNYLFDNVVEAIKDLKGFKFYFVVILIFLFASTYAIREPLTLYIKSHTDLQFRECRDISGLNKAMEDIMKKDTVVDSYTVYLYEPINNSIYKREIASNDGNVLHSPTLQGIYLSTQPTTNRELDEHDYWLITPTEMAKHPDTQWFLSFGFQTNLAYTLRNNGKVIGEVWFKFKRDPTPIELDNVLHHAAPLLYNYIL